MGKKFKGIAIFGAPGSGKTTMAKLLLASFPTAKHIEAFDAVINPAMSMGNKLPEKENDFTEIINQGYGKHVEIDASREEARDYFTYLKNRYSSSIIAKTIINIHQSRFSKKFLLVAGIRGYRNSTYFKKHGYLVVYLKSPDKHLSVRVSRRESFSQKQAEKERQIEERLFSTNKVEKIAHISFNTAITSKKEIINQIKAIVDVVECKKCVNTSSNPSIKIGSSGLCEICERYEKNFSKEPLKKELEFLLSLRSSGSGKYDAMIGISGGKDSTAALYEVKRLGFTPLAFSFDTNYYPKHIFHRAKLVAKKLGVDYEKIDVRNYIRTVDRVCYQKTADLYSQHDSMELKEIFRKWYTEGRRHYSIKCQHEIPFVRTCQLCRRPVVRAYYGEAQRRGIQLVILGINEWAGLSQDNQSKKYVFSGIRKLQPFKQKTPVYIVHLPFLLQRNINDTEKVLEKLGWKTPPGEKLIESNANSCLFARAAESKAQRMLGFHPDSTRLAREVTVGFITKKQARLALTRIHRYNKSVKQVLEQAEII